MPNGSYVVPPTQQYPAASPSGAVLGPPTTFAVPGGVPQATNPSAARQDWQSSSPTNSSPEPATQPDQKVPYYNDLNEEQGSLDNSSDGPALVSADAPETFDSDPYAEPVQRVANSMITQTSSQQAFAETVVVAAGEGTPSFPSPDPVADQSPQELNEMHFGHDPQNFRWLRGVVDYDEDEKNWNIIYDMRPSAEDAFGGSLVLVDDPILQQLNTGEVIEIEGFVAEHETDRRGLPLYKIESLSRIPTLQASR